MNVPLPAAPRPAAPDPDAGSAGRLALLQAIERKLGSVD